MDLQVEVVYALPGREDAVRVRLAAGATLGDAVAASGILQRHPELGGATLKIGVYGKLKPAEAAAAEGDRIELYRGLAVDPKEARRRRAASARARKR
jgi:putative ubiquitin-RnfH superfamily antitoxin RatB of RatAB toxin-antitoxin module